MAKIPDYLRIFAKLSGIISPMMYARCLVGRLKRLLGVMPAVYLQGARQTGKTTLAKQLLTEGVLQDYVSFDDPLVRTAARDDPVSFVRSLRVGTAIDEVQLVPEVMSVIKIAHR
jgi:predicted AAA+ superfamily ATPase